MSDPRQTWKRMRLWALLLGSFGAALYLVMPGTDAGIFGASLVLLAGSIGLAGLFGGGELRHQTETSSALDEGRVLVHWRYPPDAWHEWLARDRRRVLGATLAVLAVLGLLLAFAARLVVPAERLVEDWGAIIILLGFVGAVVALVGVWVHLGYRRLESGPREIRVSAEGIRIGDRDTSVWWRKAPFFPGGWELRKAVLRDDPVTRVEIVLRYRSFGIPQLLYVQRFRLPVPDGEADQARALVMALREH